VLAYSDQRSLVRGPFRDEALGTRNVRGRSFALIAADGAACRLLGTGPVAGQEYYLRQVERRLTVVDGGIGGLGQFLDLVGQRERCGAVTLAGEQPGSHGQAEQLGCQVLLVS